MNAKHNMINRFRSLTTACAALMFALPLLAKDVYVNPNTGSDTEHGGTSPTDAYLTLTTAVAGLGSGDIVHAAAGTYALGSATAPDGYPTRVVVPAGVTLVGDSNGEAIIKGEEGMRCVWLTGGSTPEKGAKLKGFTVREGWIIDTADQMHYGAGVASDASNAAVRHKSIVEDCLITANTNGYRGAGISSVVVKRCRIMSNYSTAHGSAAYYGILYDSIVDDNGTSGTGYAVCYQTTPAINCTFGPGNAASVFHKVDTRSSNCIFLGIVYDDADWKCKFDHCAFASDAPNTQIMAAHIGEGSYLVPAAQIQLTDDYTPIVGVCVAVDAGDNAVTNGLIDVYGNARIYNETVDIGAVEAGAALTIAASDGGIAVTGAKVGINKLTDTPVAVTVTRTFDSHYGCCGIRYNGELIRFGEGGVGESWTREFSAADGSPSIIAVYEKVWYVDANIAQEPGQTYDGRSKGRAYKTLAAAMANQDLAAGDEVRALAGTYDEGTMTPTDDSTAARVVVPAGVLLASADGADKTVVKGGTGVRGVWLMEGATVRGFTVRDANVSVEGGGVAMRNYVGFRNKAYVEDCCITNNTATRGGGISCVIARRSRILYNTGTIHAAAAYYGALYDCVVDGHVSANACTQSTTPFVNCTFGPNNTLRAITKTSGISVVNTLFMSEFQPDFGVSIDHCLFATNNVSGKVVTAKVAELDANSRLIDYREAKLKPDYSIRRRSAAVDAGLTSATNSLMDVFGNPRVKGTAVDIGAAEFNPKSIRGLMVVIH